MPSEALRRATVEQRGAQIVTAGLRNLAKIDALPYALPDSKPLDGVPALIVGAGPSLNADAHLVPEWQARGGYVFAGSNALGALARHGVKADVCVAIEALDVTRHLRGLAKAMRRLVVEQSAHPAIFDLAVRRGPRRAAWFFGQDPRNLDMCAELGVRPLYHGGATSTACVALALAWGCSPIVLLGMDLSFPDAGDAYADGAGWHGLTVRREGDKHVFEGREDRDEMHRAEGTAPVPRNRKLRMVPAIGGGEVATSEDFHAQIEWLEKVAGGNGYLLNASDSGARILGWCQTALPTPECAYCLPTECASDWPTQRKRRLVLNDWPDPMIADRVAIARVMVRYEARQAAQLARDMRLAADSLAGITGSPMIEALAAADTLRLKALGWQAPSRLQATYDVLEAAAERAEELVG